jgi:hypothetical protein
MGTREAASPDESHQPPILPVSEPHFSPHAHQSAIAGTDTGKAIRDDIRDTWHSPANRRQLAKLIDSLRDLHFARRDIEMVNISGDIHHSNAFSFQPDGFTKKIIQVTSSALTTNPPSAEAVLNLLSVDGPLSYNASSDLSGEMERLWHVDSQNFLSISAGKDAIELYLHVYNRDDFKSTANDKVLTIRPD